MLGTKVVISKYLWSEWRNEWMNVGSQPIKVVESLWVCIHTPLWKMGILYAFSSIQSLSHVQLFATPWTAGHQASLSITDSWSLPILMSIESVMPSNHLLLYHPLLLPLSIFPSIRVFSNELVLHIRWPKYWSFSFSISPSNEYLGLISFRMDWLDLLAVQGTLKSLLQQHSSKASTLQCSAFFIVQLSHSYMTTGKTIALTRWTFVGKVMSLLFNMLPRFIITFLPRSKRLLISWLQPPSAVLLEPPKIKSVTVSIVFPSILFEFTPSHTNYTFCLEVTWFWQWGWDADEHVMVQIFSFTDTCSEIAGKTLIRKNVASVLVKGD